MLVLDMEGLPSRNGREHGFVDKNKVGEFVNFRHRTGIETIIRLLFVRQMVLPLQLYLKFPL